jgi:hypothetical protein
MSWVTESFVDRDTLVGHTDNVVAFRDKPNDFAKYISYGKGSRGYVSRNDIFCWTTGWGRGRVGNK